MSDHDSEDSQSRSGRDLESNNPHYSLRDSTMDLTPQFSCRALEFDDESKNTTTTNQERYSSFQCLNTTITNLSADQNAIRRGVITDNNISGPAPIRACRCVMHHR